MRKIKHNKKIIKNKKIMKLKKEQYITYLIDCKGYTEEEARQYITYYGVLEIDDEAQKFNS